MKREVVEVCPHCEVENVFANYDVEKDGYIVKCWQCGKQICLCDECMHADDNVSRKCDWHERFANGKSLGGKCFRGETSSDRQSPHPIISGFIQKCYEESVVSAEDGSGRIPDICGVYGRACRQMNKEEGANRALCTNCALRSFAAQEGNLHED